MYIMYDLSAMCQRAARDKSRQRRQPDKGPGMNKANDGNAREISRQLGHNSRNFHENNPNFRRARRLHASVRGAARITLGKSCAHV